MQLIPWAMLILNENGEYFCGWPDINMDYDISLKTLIMTLVIE